MNARNSGGFPSPGDSVCHATYGADAVFSASAVVRASAIQKLSGKRIAEKRSDAGGYQLQLAPQPKGQNRFGLGGSMRFDTLNLRSRDEWRFLASQFGLDRIIGRGDGRLRLATEKKK